MTGALISAGSYGSSHTPGAGHRGNASSRGAAGRRANNIRVAGRGGFLASSPRGLPCVHGGAGFTVRVWVSVCPQWARGRCRSGPARPHGRRPHCQVGSHSRGSALGLQRIFRGDVARCTTVGEPREAPSEAGAGAQRGQWGPGQAPPAGSPSALLQPRWPLRPEVSAWQLCSTGCKLFAGF